MATVQKKPRKLKGPKDDPPAPAESKKPDAARGGARQKDLPPPGRKRPGELAPLNPRGRQPPRKGDQDARSMHEMGKRSPVEVDHRTSLTATTAAKSCFFYIDDDYTFGPVKMVIHPKKHRKMETVTRDLSVRMKSLPFGVRSIFTPRAKHRVHTLEELTQDGHYVCSSNRKAARGLDVQRVNTRNVWHHARPDSGKRVLNNLLKDFELQSAKGERGRYRPGYDLSRVYTRQAPKKVTVMRNGEPDQKHMLLLNRRTAQTFEQVLKTMSDLFRFAVRRLYTIEGAMVDGLNKVMNGPDYLVAAGLEPYINMTMDGGVQSRTRTRTQMGSQMNLRSRMQSRRDRLAKTKGQWKVTIRTNALPSAGTQSQVTITVYGEKGNSGPCTLGLGDGSNFQPGQVDEFDISVGNVGNVYKIRLAHDNSGDFPGWLCDEVHMSDRDTGEELNFSCRRWLARDEDDQEITRELAVKRPREPILPLNKYQVDVYTGDLWGGGTEANVYITIYGDRGDTGVRQLYAETKGVYFRQGQMDSFELEAVSLGHLKRIIVGHDGTGQGSGWYLDKIVIREPPFRQNQEYTFYCGKWLDEGEDDGKIVRELRVQDEYMDDILEKRNWEFEKWKFERDGQVMFYSVMTGKALRVNKDLRVDGVGEEKDRHCVFNVMPKKPMKPMLAVSLNPSNYLAIDGGNITGAGKGGPFCEFRVRVQQDRTVLLESVKNPLQFITIGANGAPGEVRGILDKEPSRRFNVYPKGMFRHMGVIMLCTSLTQCINLVKEDDSDGDGTEGMFRHKGVIMLCTSLTQCINLVKDDDTLMGTGRRSGPLAQFRVHKVSTGGIRMFESLANPGNYIRLKDGKIDCRGGRDEDSQFLVLRHKDKGYITLQSAAQRGLFLGMTQEGKVHTTIDTGVRNIWLYPEVVQWGVPRTKSTELMEESALHQVRREPSTPASKGSPRGVPRTKSTELMEESALQQVRREPSTPASEAARTPTPAKQFAEPEEDEVPVEEGDWSIQVSTINELTNGDVAIVCYGDQGNSGPIVLGAPPGKPIFQSGNDDEFRANLLKIGKMYKVRLELLSKISTRDPSWKVRDVRMQDLTTDEVVTFNFNRWLSRKEDDNDIMRELPVVRAGENVLPVNKYVVSVLTGKEMGSETDATPYINVFGERGDWGKRYLTKSNNSSKFRMGQEDIFTVEAVSLGSLQRCVLGHDSTGDGQGWNVERVVIKEAADSANEFVFPCDRWLDTGMEDRKIERTLMVKDSAEADKPPTESTEKCKYNLEIVTDAESSSPNGGKVHITLYGDQKKSDQIELYSANPNEKTFEPGNVDTFTVETDNLGELYKIRIGRDDGGNWDRWGLGEVRLTNEASKETIVFACNRWLARDMDDGDLYRELPVIVDGKPRGVLRVYQISVYTGDHWGANTDANMYITVHGTRGDSGKRLLHKSMNNNLVKFKRGQMDTFEMEAVGLEELTSVVVSHDGHGHGAGVFIDKVAVREKDTDKSNLQYLFPCGRWLDDHEDDCLTERTLRMLDVKDSAKPKSKESKRSSGNWTVAVRTSQLVKTTTTAKVYLTVYGTNGKTDKWHLSEPEESPPFVPGGESCFPLETGNIGRISKIRLEHDNSGSSPDWKVDYVKFTDNDTSEELVFYLDRWLAMDQDDGQICREIPVVRKGTPGLPVLHYVVALTTGGYKDAGIDNGNVSINLIGVDGDTGIRELAGPISKNRLPWQSGQTDIYTIEAVSVGKLKKIELCFIGAGQGPRLDNRGWQAKWANDRWFVETVGVSEGARASTQSVCYCHQWLLSSGAQVAEFPVSSMQPSTTLLDGIESIPRGFQKSVKSKGSWTVYVQTGTQNDSGTSEKVCLVLCGLKGEAEPVRINGKDGLNPGSLVKFEAKTPEIGLVFKVRILFEDKHVGSSWFLNKMKLKDVHTGEELHFEHNDWLESTLENPEGAVELPVVRPDLQPLKEQIYIVSVKTGDLPLSETDASLYCNLIGQWGSTGVRSLSVSSQKEPCRLGQTDSYTLTCIDLGEIEKVIIGHETVGRGQGWFCESVTVKVAEEAETMFPCNRWLDTGCDDRLLKAELKPLVKLPESMYPPSKYVNSKGAKWNFHITYAGKDRLSMLQPGHKAGEVSIVVYGYNSVKGPLELTGDGEPVKLLLPGKTEHFYDYAFDDLGEIEKIRVSSGYEGDTENVWTIQQIVLEDQTSREMLTFDFRAWVGEVGGDIRKEMPLVLPGKTHRQVVQYYIEVHTSEAEMNASTNANVYVTIYGSNSDSGRRHLIKSKTSNKRFQTGQVEAVDLGDLEKMVVAKGPGKPWLLDKVVVKRGEFAKEHVDKFVLEAVDLGDLEKLVVAKGPGKPWLLDKVVVKRGEFAEEEHVFMYNGWIGDKKSQNDEIEATLQLTSSIPSEVAVPIQEAPDLEISAGCWVIEGTTGGRRGPDGPLDLVVVFAGRNGETKPLSLQSSRDNPFQIGQTDQFKVKYDEKIGELRKVRLGFIDQSVAKAWYVRKIAFEDQDSHDVFSADLNEWVAIDNKLDGWREIPVPWPAIKVPQVLKYVVSVQVGDVNSDGQDREIYLQMYGDHGNSGRRLLKHSLSNTDKIRPNQVDVFEVEAVDLGDLIKITVGHTDVDKEFGWFLDYVQIQESQEDKGVVFNCNKWLGAGGDDYQTERTLFPSDAPIQKPAQPQDNTNNSNAPNTPEVIVPLIPTKSATPTPEPTQDQIGDTEARAEAEDNVEEVKDEEDEVVQIIHDGEVEERREPEEETTETDRQIEYEPTPEPPQDEGVRWSVTTMTGGGPGEESACPVQVILYGDQGHSSPYIIGDKQGFKFRTGNTDNFNLIIQEDVGEVFKVRLGFAEDVYDEWCANPQEAPSWFLSKLTLRNDASMKEYEFEAGMWVCMNEAQDYWRELPVSSCPRPLDVFQYQVSVVTSSEDNAGFEGSVFLQVFGENGDTGYRRLMASQTHQQKFAQGNEDLFEIGAVNLGKLSKIRIKNDNPGLAAYWLLDRVVICESEEAGSRYVFKWGSGLEEDETELQLTEIQEGEAEKTEEPQQEEQEGEGWTVQTLTGVEGSLDELRPMKLVLYDVEGNKQAVVIGDQQGFCFRAESFDEFHVRVPTELQRLYKVRVGFLEAEAAWFSNYDQAPTWYLKQLLLTHAESQHQFDVKCPAHVKIDAHQDYWRELPVFSPEGRLPAVYRYQLEVCTGQQSEPGQDLVVHMNIFGSKGDTGMRRLMASKSGADRFSPGKVDLFELEAVDLGNPIKVKVKVAYEGQGDGTSWHIDKILVKDSEDSRTKYVFNRDGLADEDQGKPRVTQFTQEFPLTGVTEGEEEQQQQLPGNPWTVSCVTGSELQAGSQAPVELVLYDSRGQTRAPVVIGDEENFTFTPGQRHEFKVRVEGDIEELFKVRVGFHGDQHSPWYRDYSLAPSWFVEEMSLTNDTTGSQYHLDAGVAVNVEEYTDFWRELPVTNINQPGRMVRYQVEVSTGQDFTAGTEAIVTLQVYGERGDTGARRLMNSITNDTRFLAGQKDEFEIPAVDLGPLTQVKVTHDATGPDSAWLIERVVVRDSDSPSRAYVFECGRTLAGGDDSKDVEVVYGQEVEVTLTLTEVTEEREETVESMEPKAEDVKDGDWKVIVKTGASPDSGTDSNVTLTVYGDADNSGPITLGSASTGYFYSDTTDEFDVFIEPDSIGQIRKIRLEHDNSGKGWNVEKLTMINRTDNSQIEFVINKWLMLDKRGFDIAVEMPVQGQDWPVRDYIVRTETGDGFGSGTDAQVYINLIGTLGDSGKRWLVHNLEETERTFESGQLDTFIVQAVDLGRLCQVEIGHNGRGPGSGWFLKQVQLKESLDAPETYVFTCDNWFHDEKGDGQTERLLSLDTVNKDPDFFLPVGYTPDQPEEPENTTVTQESVDSVRQACPIGANVDESETEDVPTQGDDVSDEPEIEQTRDDSVRDSPDQQDESQKSLELPDETQHSVEPQDETQESLELQDETQNSPEPEAETQRDENEPKDIKVNMPDVSGEESREQSNVDTDEPNIQADESTDKDDQLNDSADNTQNIDEPDDKNKADEQPENTQPETDSLPGANEDQEKDEPKQEDPSQDEQVDNDPAERPKTAASREASVVGGDDGNAQQRSALKSREGSTTYRVPGKAPEDYDM